MDYVNDQDDHSEGAADEREPDSNDRDAEGDAGDGAEQREPGSTAAGAKRSDPAKRKQPEFTEADDSQAADADFSDLAELLTNPKSKKDEEESEDDKSEKDDTAEEDEAEGETDDDEGADATSEKKDDEETAEKDESDEDDADDAEKPDPDALTDAEKRSLSKSASKKLERLVKLKPAAAFGQEIAEIGKKGRFQDEKTLMNWLETGGIINTAKPADAVNHLLALALDVQTQGKAGRLPAAERANLIRALADRISPAPVTTPKVMMLPDDLAEMVTNESLSKEEAETLAINRLRKTEKATAKEPAAKVEETEDAGGDEQSANRGPTKADYDRGIEGARQVYRELKAKYPNDWAGLEKAIVKRVSDRSERTHPLDFATLVRDQAEVVIASIRKPTKIPPKSPAPSKRSSTTDAKKTRDMSDDEFYSTIASGDFSKLA